MMKRLLADLRAWSEFDRELAVNSDKDITQDMCDRYCEITKTALDVLKEHSADKYSWYELYGTTGNEIELFADAIEAVLISCFKAMLDDKDKQAEAIDAKVEMQEEINEDDVYNSMMLMINDMIKYMPELQDVVNEHYEQVK